MKVRFAKFIVFFLLLYPILALAQIRDADLVIGIKDRHLYLYDLETGKIIIPPIYDGVNSMTINGYSVGKYRHQRNSMIKYCEEEGYMRLRFNPYFFTIMKKNKWAIADTTGIPLSPFQYDMIIPSSHKKIAVAQIGKNFGLLNDKGDVILDVKYQIPFDCFDCNKSEVIATRFLSFEDKKYLINDYGKDWQWYNLGLDDAVLFGLDGSDMFFEFDGLIGSVDSIGKIIIPFKYEIIKSFLNQNRYDPQLPLQCRINDKWGLVDKNGIEIVQCQYDTIGWYSDNLISVNNNNKWGWIEFGTWKEIVPCLYDEVGEISEGAFAVKKNNKWGYLNKNADPFTEFIFESVGPFINGFAEVVLDGRIVRINYLGNAEE